MSTKRTVLVAKFRAGKPALVLLALAIVAYGGLAAFVRIDLHATSPASSATNHVAAATQNDVSPSAPQVPPITNLRHYIPPTLPDATTVTEQNGLVGPRAILLARAGTSGIYTITTADQGEVEWQPRWGNFEWIDGAHTGVERVTLVLQHPSGVYKSNELNFRLRAAGDAALGDCEFKIKAGEQTYVLKVTVST